MCDGGYHAWLNKTKATPPTIVATERDFEEALKTRKPVRLGPVTPSRVFVADQSLHQSLCRSTYRSPMTHFIPRHRLSPLSGLFAAIPKVPNCQTNLRIAHETKKTCLILFGVVRVHLFLTLDNTHPRTQPSKLRRLLQGEVKHLAIVIEGLCRHEQLARCRKLLACNMNQGQWGDKSQRDVSNCSTFGKQRRSRTLCFVTFSASLRVLPAFEPNVRK